MRRLLHTCCWTLMILLSLTGAVEAQSAPAAPETLKILSDAELPAAFKHAYDVDWASDSSVYLAMLGDGVVEAGLDPAGKMIREMVPPRSKPGGYWSCHFVAASSQYMVVAGPALSLTWRRISDATRQEEAFATIQGLDVQDNRLLILGAQRSDKWEYGADGAIAWLGNLDKGISDLKPVLYAASGPGVHEMGACAAVPLGNARFLSDGSFVIAPGVQPGVNLYDKEGKLLRTWDTGKLGIDTDCAGVSPEQMMHLAADYPQRLAWINQRRTVDSMLPLPQGAGLIVRSVEKGKAQWTLLVLSRDGSTRSYAVPIQASNEFFHLRGDVRSGKIVFLLHETPPADKDYAPPHLIVAGAPAT